MTPGDAVEAEKLAARRGFATLFSNVSFAVRAGEMLVVTGPNGSGKTTLLRMLAGLTQPAEGRILWRQRVVRAFDPALRDAVAFNGHLPALKDELTAEENLAHWIALDDARPPRERVERALDDVALGRRSRLPVRVLSQGQRRRIGLARLALLQRPIWILDEPQTALDVDGIAILRALLDAHLGRGGLCITATHQPLSVTGGRVLALRLGEEVNA
jgi:heme exporter protein A